MNEVPRFDAVVVGAGPAGSAAALALARAGRSVCLIERGAFPGAKNMFGGVIYGRVLDGIIPEWWKHAPVERWVTRRSTMMCTPTQSLSIDFRTNRWSSPPYNGATAYRPDFDQWLAAEAVAAGARLLSSTVVTGLLKSEGQIVGVTTDRPDGDIFAEVVIACDGVNSFVAKSAGLYDDFDPEHFTVGVKETIRLGESTINERFAVRGNEGVDIEIVGCTEGVAGGGFIYTNRETVSIGVVLSVQELGRQQQRPERILGTLKQHPSIAPLIEGGEVVEYSAHVIPEGGLHAMPELYSDRILVAGDAAAMCLAAGIWLEGVNFAIGSGHAAGLAAAEALRKGDCSRAGLASYVHRLETSFVLADHRKLAEVPGLIMSDRVQRQYPGLMCDFAEEVFTVRNPHPKQGFRQIVRSLLKARGIKIRDVVRDGIKGAKGFG